MNRIDQINTQFTTAKQVVSQETISVDGKTYPESVDNNPSKGIKADYFKSNGWGYKDSGFFVDLKHNTVRVKGGRYMYEGKGLDSFLEYIVKHLAINPQNNFDAQTEIPCTPPSINHAFVEELGVENLSRRSFTNVERIMHSHGHTFQEIHQLRHGRLQRYIDMVVYPANTEQVENLVKLANKHNVVLVPYGGGTNVTQSLMLPLEEKRMMVSVSTKRMDAIKWVDKENNLACVGAGMQGQDMERELKQYGVCSGHEPDSAEFSTVGGWVATRASGMKKNTYGNIEDIVQNVTMVTSKGTYRKVNAWARISNGPDLNHLMMGSEGNLGIITEVVMRVRPLPETRIYDSILFYDWESGLKFMNEVSKERLYPTSIRLVDNLQFQFGASLKPPAESAWEAFVDKAKKFFVLNVKGFEHDKLTACTLLFEGNKEQMEAQHQRVINISKKYKGMVGGAENGMRGYLLTFQIAYVRDLACQHFVAAESFETTVSWENVGKLCSRTNQRIIDEALKLGFTRERVWISTRVTQLYETGCAVYVYFSLNHHGMDNDKIMHNYELVEDAARDEVMNCGGSISHHHGIGKIRKGFVERTLPPMAIEWQKSIKDTLDPNNVFAINNTIYRSEEERLAVQKKF